MLLDITFDLGAIDQFGIIVAIVGYIVVFVVLILMFTIYNSLPKVLNIKNRYKMRKKGEKECEECEDITGEINAAMSMALHLYFNEMHDVESDKMTIKKVSKRYSPWSSKIYELNPYFQNLKR
ncbi:MAG: OadG family protein [Bacteroidales bacterium]|nr:OadG family protein [Bacteroidales bacterium]MCF8332783.1 OadG family protein [Bacteroidales bacterium]